LNPLLVISLDFELHWGSFDKFQLAKRKTIYSTTRAVIPQILDLFSKYEIKATWATVGFLFFDKKSELLAAIPKKIPNYYNRQISSHSYLMENYLGDSETEDPYHFAKSLVSTISQTSGQEIATHTFSHYFCNEEGQTIEQFIEDIKAAQVAARSNGIEIKSLVFPRNQVNEKYIAACHPLGLKAVRTNPPDWWWKIESSREPILKRAVRTLDAYFPIGRRTSYSLTKIKMVSKILLIPASRLIKPHSGRELILNRLKIFRVKNEMTRAAIKNEIYHIWWHPHNFGAYPKQNIQMLTEILDHFQYLRIKYSMKSVNISELTDIFLANADRNCVKPNQ
jgi:peptidoglycan/xylan/chitin deacetylase (PgdA/CDA1 family)